MGLMELSKFLQERRKESRISQDVMAETMQVSRYTILNMETGVVSPSFMNVWKYAMILRIKMSDFERILDDETSEKLRIKAAKILKRDLMEKMERLTAKRKLKTKKKWNKSYKKARKSHRETTPSQTEPSGELS